MAGEVGVGGEFTQSNQSLESSADGHAEACRALALGDIHKGAFMKSRAKVGQHTLLEISTLLPAIRFWASALVIRSDCTKLRSMALVPFQAGCQPSRSRLPINWLVEAGTAAKRESDVIPAPRIVRSGKPAPDLPLLRTPVAL